MSLLADLSADWDRSRTTFFRQGEPDWVPSGLGVLARGWDDEVA